MTATTPTANKITVQIANEAMDLVMVSNTSRKLGRLGTQRLPARDRVTFLGGCD